LVGLMGGTLSVESLEGEGSTFAFDLPLVRREAAPAGEVGRGAQASSGDLGRPLRILAAEESDEPTDPSLPARHFGR